MQCPTCGEHSPPTWQMFTARAEGPSGGSVNGLARDRNTTHQVSLDWMRCSNEECMRLIIRVHDAHPTFMAGSRIPVMVTDSWIVFPRFGDATRPVDQLVPEPFRSDYAEAAAILDTSPRMSAVLSRRILGDLLKKYAGKNQGSLMAQIDAFTEERGHPSSLTSNLHHFREVANFGAHTQEDQEQAVVIDVDRDEAEWTLDLVDRLFDYFIVQPAKDEQIKRRMDEKIERAGRQPLRPGTEEEKS